MRKDGVIWFDTERGKWRVGIGVRQKHHVGRYKTLREAQEALKAATKGYKCGFNSAIGVVC